MSLAQESMILWTIDLLSGSSCNQWSCLKSKVVTVIHHSWCTRLVFTEFCIWSWPLPFILKMKAIRNVSA